MTGECCGVYAVVRVVPVIPVSHVQLPVHHLVLRLDALPFDRCHYPHRIRINCHKCCTLNSMLSIIISRCTVQWNVQTFFRITLWLCGLSIAIFFFPETNHNYSICRSKERGKKKMIRFDKFQFNLVSFDWVCVYLRLVNPVYGL